MLWKLKMSSQKFSNLLIEKVEKIRMLGDFWRLKATKCGTRSSFLFYSVSRKCCLMSKSKWPKLAPINGWQISREIQHMSLFLWRITLFWYLTYGRTHTTYTDTSYSSWVKHFKLLNTGWVTQINNCLRGHANSHCVYPLMALSLKDTW